MLSQLVLVATLFGSAMAQRACPDQWISPETDPCNPFRYIPSLPANAAFAALYFAVAIVLTWRHFRYPAKYMLALTIGAYCEGLGLAFRLMVRSDVHSTGKYIVMYLFVVLSPCAFLAADYILLGRIVAHLDANRYLTPFKANLVSWVFVISDVVTFLIQAAGGSMTISKDLKISDAGSKIFLAGIIIQAVSFVLFTLLWAVFAYRVKYQDDTLWSRGGWKPLHWALGFTCIWFIIRSIFRTIELSQGYRGYLATHEIYVLLLDTLPLLIGISVYMYWWPGMYLTADTKIDSLEALQRGGVEMVRQTPELEVPAYLSHSNGSEAGEGAGVSAVTVAGDKKL